MAERVSLCRMMITSFDFTYFRKVISHEAGI